MKAMQISIADDTKKRFHLSSTIRELKMSQVVVESVCRINLGSLENATALSTTAEPQTV